jgi:MscS family membrane protein
MPPFFETVYFDNTVWQYTQFILTVLGAFVAAGVLHVTVIRKLVILTKRTKTKVDDEILAIIRNSLNLLALILGIYYGRSFLTLNEQINGVIGVVLLVLVTLEIARVSGEVIALGIEGYIHAVAEKKKDINKDLLIFFQRLSKIVIWAIAIMLIINNLGYNIASLLAGLGLGGLAFALAAQQTLGNFFGSVSIIVDQPFQVGDLVLIDNMKGRIKRVGLRSTRITTLDGTEVSIPNSKTASSLIENFSKRPNVKIMTNLGVEYDTPIKKLDKGIDIVRNILDKRDDIYNHRVHFTKFEDSSLVIEVAYWIEYYPEWADVLQAQNDINMEIKKQFEKAKISFAFPTQTIHVKK